MLRPNKIIISLLLLLSLFVLESMAASRGSVSVKGYTRKDGTYVAPHYRSAPDGNFQNNWSTKGNVNPYSGNPGTLTAPPGQTSGSGSLDTKEAQRMADRKEYWKGQGVDVDKINAYNSYDLDSKIKEAQRMADRKEYWKGQGVDVDKVNALSSDDLDAKMSDLEAKRREIQRMAERKAYWKSQGFDVDKFNALSSDDLDAKAREAEKARSTQKN